jgi:hypothetical protein
MKILAMENELKAIPPGLREDTLKREASEAWRLEPYPGYARLFEGAS